MRDIGSWMGISNPNRKNERKHNINAVMKNVRDPSKVLFEFVQGNPILIFPHRLPITEASVSDIIIIRTPAIGK